MSSDAQSGRARVRKFFWQPVEEAGLKRPSKLTVEAWSKLQAKLSDWLAYMSAENLAILADLMVEHPQGRNKDEWPPEVMIRQWAKGLQTKPVTEAPIIRSWLASVEGPAAEAGGFVVELYRELVRHPVPPTPFDMRNIRKEAAENARQVVRIEERIASGRASDDDRTWLEAYRRDHEIAMAIIAEGTRRRTEADVA